MRFRKIPRSWLIHSVKLADVHTELGAFGDSDVNEGQTVDHVRIIKPNHALTVTANNEQSSMSAILIHQPDVSTEHTFRVGEHIYFGEQLCEVVGVNPMYELKKLHHTEVELSYVYADNTGN